MSENKFTNVPDTADLKNELSYFLLVLLVLGILGSLAASLYYYFKLEDSETGFSFMLLTIAITFFTFAYYGVMRFIASRRAESKEDYEK